MIDSVIRLQPDPLPLYPSYPEPHLPKFEVTLENWT